MSTETQMNAKTQISIDTQVELYPYMRDLKTKRFTVLTTNQATSKILDDAVKKYGLSEVEQKLRENQHIIPEILNGAIREFDIKNDIRQRKLYQSFFDTYLKGDTIYFMLTGTYSTLEIKKPLKK
jgi:hypothetical protein